MENQHYKIDEIFRQRLHDAEVPPPPFVWPAVEHELQKRRRRLLFVWLFAFCTVAASVWLWQSNQRTMVTPGHSNAPVADITTNVLEPNPPAVSESSNTISDATTAEKPKSSPSSQSSSGVSPSILTKEKELINDDYSPTAYVAFNKQASKIPSKESLQAATPTGHSEGDGEETKSPATANIEAKANESSFSDNPLKINGPQSVVSLSNKKKELLLKTVKSRAHLKKIQPKFCYDFARHPSAWLLDVYAGPSLAQRSLTSRLDDQPYLNQRLATERRSVAMNAGIRASLMFNSNFLVRTGLHYDQVTEVFEYIDPTTVIYRLQFTPGNPIPDTLGVEYGENYLKTYNRYSMLDVPLMVGVEMRRGRSGFSINAGVSANVVFQKRGVIIDPIAHEPARFGPVPNNPNAVGPKTSLSQDVFRTNVGLSAMASIQWYWHLNPHFRLFAEPSFRQVLRPVTLGSHPVEQRYSILGLRLGATKIF